MRLVVVFDTNVLISALLSPSGNPSRCLELARRGRVQSVTCEEILEEFQQKLLFKFNYLVQDAQAVVHEILRYSYVVEITDTLSVLTTDAADNKILECASLGGATHIVTGDKKHLLPLGSYQGIAIINATDFLALVAAD